MLTTICLSIGMDIKPVNITDHSIKTKMSSIEQKQPSVNNLDEFISLDLKNPDYNSDEKAAYLAWESFKARQIRNELSTDLSKRRAGIATDETKISKQEINNKNDRDIKDLREKALSIIDPELGNLVKNLSADNAPDVNYHSYDTIRARIEELKSKGKLPEEFETAVKGILDLKIRELKGSQHEIALDKTVNLKFLEEKQKLEREKEKRKLEDLEYWLNIPVYNSDGQIVSAGHSELVGPGLGSLDNMHDSINTATKQYNEKTQEKNHDKINQAHPLDKHLYFLNRQPRSPRYIEIVDKMADIINSGSIKSPS
jgi:hypothetical protein